MYSFTATIFSDIHCRQDRGPLMERKNANKSYIMRVILLPVFFTAIVYTMCINYWFSCKVVRLTCLLLLFDV